MIYQLSAPEKQHNQMTKWLFTLAQCSYKSASNLLSVEPRPVHCIAKQTGLVCDSKAHLSTAVLAFSTPLHPTLCIAFVQIKLGCSCSATETHSIEFWKLLFGNIQKVEDLYQHVHLIICLSRSVLSCVRPLYGWVAIIFNSSTF